MGGTSQGAFVGALYAKNPDDFGQLENTAREMAESMSSSLVENLCEAIVPAFSAAPVLLRTHPRPHFEQKL